jgi:hypothetical protein
MLKTSYHGLKRTNYSVFVVIVCSALNQYVISIFRPFSRLFAQIIHSIEFDILENISLHGFGAKIREKIIPLQYRGKIIPLLSSV